MLQARARPHPHHRYPRLQRMAKAEKYQAGWHVQSRHPSPDGAIRDHVPVHRITLKPLRYWRYQHLNQPGMKRRCSLSFLQTEIVSLPFSRSSGPNLTYFSRYFNQTPSVGLVWKDEVIAGLDRDIFDEVALSSPDQGISMSKTQNNNHLFVQQYNIPCPVFDAVRASFVWTGHASFDIVLF